MATLEKYLRVAGIMLSGIGVLYLLQLTNIVPILLQAEQPTQYSYSDEPVAGFNQVQHALKHSR